MGCFRGKSTLVGNVLDEPLHERFEGHCSEVLIAPGAHCDGTCFLFLVAHDEDVRELLQRMLPYFIRNLLVVQIQLDPKPLILQRFRH